MPVAGAVRSLQEQFGKAIRRRREALGISQEDLADQAGIHRTYQSQIERGIANPSLSKIEALAEALGSSVSSIFKEAERA